MNGQSVPPADGARIAFDTGPLPGTATVRTMEWLTSSRSFGCAQQPNAEVPPQTDPAGESLCHREEARTAPPKHAGTACAQKPALRL